LKDEKVFIYHPWSIDPLWRKGEEGKRIFVIEPRLFNKFPVSKLVMEHMLTLLSVHVPDVQIYVGNIETLPDIEKAEVFSKRHPATQHYPGTQDRGEELYPEVQGYFTSFFNFWKACNS
jgi:deoxyribodipyrimidine photo-lyase